MNWRGSRVRVLSGWENVGRQGIALGEPVLCEQMWLPVLWDGDHDPDFIKARAVEILIEGNGGEKKRGGGEMTIDEYQEAIKNYLMTNPMTEDVANILAELVLDASENMGEIDIAPIETLIWGERVECPRCHSMVLPGDVCFGCDEWTAPK